MLAHSYLLKFCQSFEELYGKDRVTPNTHLHTHLVDHVLDYGTVYAFWLFSFEHYNGILGEYGTNQRAVEIQLIRKFTSTQFMKDIPLPTVLQEVFKPVLDKLVSKQSGSLHDQLLSEHADNISQRVISASRLSIGPVLKGGHFTRTDILYTCCGPFSRDCIEAHALPHLKNCYAAIFDGVDETSVTTHFERFLLITFLVYAWCKSGHA